MFTGIIEELGEVKSVTNSNITIKSNRVVNGTSIGESISVNGVCLTVTDIGKDYFTADISQETKRVTSLNNIRPSSYVNLERAMLLNGRFGGHIVTGHVDGIGKIISAQKNGEFFDMKIIISEKDAAYVVKKGSVTINGISLTVADINDKELYIAIIPHTYENTNLKYLKSGDVVNVETDILAKYVEKFLSTSDNRTGISMEFLRENGF